MRSPPRTDKKNLITRDEEMSVERMRKGREVFFFFEK